MKSISKIQIENQKQITAIALTSVCLALFIVNLDDAVISMALPKIQISLDVTLSGLQWILNTYILAMACLVLPSGSLIDTFGHKRLFLLALVIFTMASVICGLAPNLTLLLVGRTIQGIGAAAIIPGSLSILSDIFPDPKKKMQAFGVCIAVSGIARVGGPAFGGLLIDTLGWQSLFFLNLPFGIIIFWITSRFVREVKRPMKHRIDVLGMVLSIVFLASFASALTGGDAGTGQLSLMILLLAFAGLSLIAFLLVESRSSHPMLPLSLFRNPAIAVVSIVNMLAYFTIFSLIFIFSLFLQQVQGYSAAEAGVRFLPMNAAFAIGALFSGWFAARVGWRFACAIGLMLACMAVFSFINIGADTEYGDVLSNFVISGFGIGLALAPMTATAMSVAPPTQVGIVSSVIQTTTSLGGVLGIALQGKILYQKLSSELARSLMAWGIPSNLQEQIVAEVLHGGLDVPSNLPANINPSALNQAISNGFVSGLQATLLVASFALFFGALLIIGFVKPTFNQTKANSPVSLTNRTKKE